MTTSPSRMLALLSLLQVRREWSGAVLAERLQISRRTVRRDIERLRELGYPIAATRGPEGGYRLTAGTELPPLLFDDEQAIAVAVGLQLVAEAGAGMEEGSERALASIRQVMPNRLRRRLDALQITRLRPPGPGPPESQVDSRTLAAIADATRAQNVLRFVYARSASDGEDAPVRRAEPHHLLTWDGRWYLLAWDLDRRDWRTFRVDRMQTREHHGGRFSPRQVPGGDLHRYVASRFRGSDDNSGDWPCRGSVVLDTPAENVRPYAGDGLIEALGPRQCRISLGAWSWIGLAALIARFDADVEQVEPAELAGAFTTLSARCARAGAPAAAAP